MKPILKVAVVIFSIATLCVAQEPLVPVTSRGEQTWPATEIDKIYRMACSAVQREFGINHSIAPRVSLLLGADRNRVDFETGNVLLVKWDRELFAQGVVLLAFEHLMPVERRLTITKRAVDWADATLEVAQHNK